MVYESSFAETLELEKNAIIKNFIRYTQLGDNSAQVALIISSCCNTISAQEIRGQCLSPDNLFQALVQYREMVEIHKRLTPQLAAVSVIISEIKTPDEVINFEHWDRLRELFEEYKPGTGTIFVWSEDARHIRNSLSHGTKYPNMEASTIKFVDLAWEKEYTFDEFVDIFNSGVYWIMGICHAILLSRNITFEKMIDMSRE